MKKFIKLSLIFISLTGAHCIHAASTSASDLITFSREEATARVKSIMTHHFVEKTDIVKSLCSGPINPTEVELAVESSIYDYCQIVPRIICKQANIAKPLLIGELLK